MIIGFCGKRTSGKTECAKFLIEKRGFHKAKFAAPLKAALRVAFGLTEEHTDGALKEVPLDLLGGRSARDAMEWFGEESRQQFGLDVWVNRWFATEYDPLKAVVFDDVRNPTEAEAIQRHGGIIVRLLRHEADALPILPSEQYLPEIKPNFTIDNDGDVTELHAWVRQVLRIHASRYLESAK